MSITKLSFASIALAVVACGPKAPVSTDTGATPLTVHTWTSSDAGFHTHSHWVDTGREVVVFDAQFTPELAQELVADIQATTDSPIATVVVTHPNPDKFLGAPVFQALGAEVVASEATAAALPGVHAYKKAFFVGAGAFTEDSFPALPSIDRTFEDELVLDTAVPVRLVELDHSGVTSNQTVAIAGDHLFAGDLTAGRTHAWLEGAIIDGAAQPDLEAWQAALDELAELGDERSLLHPGRGETLPLARAVEEQKAYLASANTIVADYVAGLDAPFEALTGAESGAHYDAITAAVAAEWPQLDHAYLVRYGVYGLALSEASK